MINVFSVEPRDCETLVAILTEGIRRVTSKQPGFVSSTIHASLDGTRVVNYAQWESRAAYDQLFENAEMVLFMEDLKERLRFARADASAYEVRIVIGKTGADD